MTNFTHLHLHTEYSLLDGVNKLKLLAKHIKSLGMDSVGVSDHGNLFGAIEFYTTMKQEGIKPIIGMEAYIHNKEVDNKDPKTPRFHVCLFAKNEIGYKNLMYLSSQSFIKGFYRFPRINKQLLKEHKEGIICSSACLQGEISWHLNTNNQRNVSFGARGYEGALEAAYEYKDIFGDDFYIEIMRHGIQDQLLIDNLLIKLSKETNIKLIATNDAHYLEKDNASMQEVAMCVAMGKILADKDRLRHSVQEFYIKSPKQMQELFFDIPEAISNTQEIVSKCNLEIDLKNDSTNPPTPPSFIFAEQCALEEGIEFINEEQYFRHKCKEGLQKRLKIIPSSKHQSYIDRLQKEMDIISLMKFPGYMLIVWDFISYAKAEGIPVGPGRGSVAGCLVAFCLEITDIDPMRYGLIFERFLNPERISMPDIDTDFCQRKRGLMLNYMSSRYGQYNVAQVITFGKMLAKGVLRDVARVLDMPYADADSFAKLIPNQLGITLSEAYDKEIKIKELISSNPLAKKVWEMSLKLEGLNRNAGKHAAALVVDSHKELWHKVPLYTSERTKGAIVTQYSMKYLEAVDLIKFDFLGLKTLTVIDDTLNLIKSSYGVEIDFLSLDENDKKVYETLQSGNTLGIFQVESGGMQELNQRLRPTNFEDIIAILALYRPGPMDSGMVDDFINRKHGLEEITYPFKELEEILKPTYGVIVYQEQVMQIVQTIGGFTLGEADLIRRAMGKKDAKILQENKIKFVKGGEKQGYDVARVESLYDLILKFAEYGFNKSHSAAYAMITFQTAYLKTYYEYEFMAAMLTSESNKIESVAKYIDEVRSMGITILPPHVNTSLIDFSVIQNDSKKQIVFGLGAIKGAGDAPLKNIIEMRKLEGDFLSLEDFIQRVDFNTITKRILEPLVKSGSLDNLGYSRACMLNHIDKICEVGRLSVKRREESSFSLFNPKEVPIGLNIKNSPEFSSKILLEHEYESIGIYVSGHPLDEYKQEIASMKNVTKIPDLATIKTGSQALIIAKIEDLQKRISKQGRTFGTAKIIDLQGKSTLTLFENQLNNLDKLDMNMPIGFKCKVEKEQIDEGEFKINLKLLETYPYEECLNSEIYIKTTYDKKSSSKSLKKGTFKKSSSFEAHKPKPFNSNEVFDNGLNEVIKLDIAKDFGTSCTPLAILLNEDEFKSLKQEDILQIASLAKSNSGNKPLKFEITGIKEVIVLESNMLVSENIKGFLPQYRFKDLA